MLEFFGNDVEYAEQAQGEQFLDYAWVTTDANGYAEIDVELEGAYGRFVTATAADPGNNTSEFSDAVESIASGNASVGDRVWHDLNSNGLQDPGEPGAADVFVELIAVDGSYFDNAFTDGSGNYLFTDVPLGDYYVRFYLPDGYVFTLPYQGEGDPTIDSDPLSDEGSTAVFTLGAGEVELTCDAGLIATASGQWANDATASSEWGAYPGDYSAAQVIGEPNVDAYGDSPFAWAALNADEGIQTLTVSFATPVHATGVTIRESYGNGFVVQIDLIDEFDQVHTDIWTGTDTSQPGSLVDFMVSFEATSYLVKGVIIHVNTDHNLGDWEEIDAVMLHGDTGGGFAAMSTGGADAAGRVRVRSVRRPNRGPVATLRASGPVTLGVPVSLLFSNPRDRLRPVASSFRYSFDFNNDGDFADPGEVLNGTSLSARHTFTRRGWQIIHGRVRSLDGRYTDFWLRVFVG